ncbi:MAG: aminotransferase class I/II-fold pyridoxal phosphate-dependent enzyme [candidate division Zixibacteria bacterium]|nr:aminotransferase class I/II-fold pyridoxal phosphate-dependent enzyme [candidate division Zixibacteria bacterium]MCI0596643.1 aminotransferase class I/II-fold pyridoxal phosphate-dependent enzyme [candidate division Zixibacteria bacterium]
MDLFTKCYKDTRAEEVQKAGLYPYFHPISSALGTEVVMDGKKLLMIGSNNYLGLVSHPKVKEAAAQAALKYGSGCTGSRFLNGTLDLHIELERRLAAFVNKEAALAFSTGFQTNLGTISALVSKGDFVIADRADHASIVDGCRLSFGKTIKYLHNDMEDLCRILSKIDHDAGKLVVVDGVFSMEGDIVRLPEVVKLAKKHKSRLMVDDAHAVGVLGKNGRGTAEHFNLEDNVDLIMGTFSKSFASLGGFVAGDRPVIEFIKHFSREMIFSASMPPAAVAAVLAALDIIETEPERRERLWEITGRMHKEFKLLGFDIGATETPIVPAYIGEDLDAFKFWRALLDEGIFANAIISPATPPGKALIRTSYTATHTDDQLDFVLETFKKLGKAFGII